MIIGCYIRCQTINWTNDDILIILSWPQCLKVPGGLQAKMTCLPLLTLQKVWPEYSGRTRLTPSLLISWFLASPGHQQPWYLLCRIYGPLFSIKKYFEYLCYLSVGKIWINLDGLVQDCSISIANTLEILQSCIKPSIPWFLKIIQLVMG